MCISVVYLSEIREKGFLLGSSSSFAVGSVAFAAAFAAFAAAFVAFAAAAAAAVTCDVLLFHVVQVILPILEQGGADADKLLLRITFFFHLWIVLDKVDQDLFRRRMIRLSWKFRSADFPRRRRVCKGRRLDGDGLVRPGFRSGF